MKVSRYVDTTAMSCISWSTEMEYSLNCEILMDIKSVNILEIYHGTYLQVYPQASLLVTQMYSKTHSTQDKTIQLDWINLVYTSII